MLMPSSPSILTARKTTGKEGSQPEAPWMEPKGPDVDSSAVLAAGQMHCKEISQDTDTAVLHVFSPLIQINSCLTGHLSKAELGNVLIALFPLASSSAEAHQVEAGAALMFKDVKHTFYSHHDNTVEVPQSE